MSHVADARRPSYPPEDDREALIAAHMPLVRRLAWHVHGRMSATVEPEELMQVGMVALIEAARGFEDRGFAFATYASTRIRGAMIDQLRRSSRQSRGAAANRRALDAARRRVEIRLSRCASPLDVAGELELDMPAYYALEAQADSGQEVDLDSAYSDEDMRFCDTAARGEDAFDERATRAALAEAIATLPQREQMVLQLYFFEEMNLDEIGHTLQIGASRVCQIKKAALDRLKAAMA